MIRRYTVYEIWNKAGTEILGEYRIEKRREWTGMPWAILDEDGDIHSLHASLADAIAAVTALCVLLREGGR